jgi:outer membrane receptor protein involved in Fe transport
MRRQRVCFWIISALIPALLFSATPSLGQMATGTILGLVKDSSGSSLPDTSVTIENVDTSLTRTAMTSSDGSFNFPELPTGHYQVQATHAGFKTETHKGITLEVTEQAVINFTLELGTQQQQVIVTGDAPIVNTQDATLGGLVNEASIKDLPLNGRNYINLSLLQAGVTQDKNFIAGPGQVGTSFSANGAPVRSNNFTLDGAILQNQFGRNPASEAGNTLGVEGIKEFKVITSNFPAEYGVTMGSQMVMVSSNGTNQFHGDAFEYLRNAALDAKNFFDFGPIPKFQRNNFGGSLGGPIKKDKTYFFGVYEELRQNLGVTSLLNVPSAGCHGPAGAVITAAECPDILPAASVTIDPGIAPFLALFKSPNLPPPAPGSPPEFTFPSTSVLQEHYGQLRVDQTFSPSDTFFGRYTIDDDTFNNATTSISASNVGQNFPYFRLAGTTRNQYLTLAENHIFSPSVLNTARFSFSRTRYVVGDNNQGLPNNDLGPPIIPGHETGLIQIAGYSNMGPAGNIPPTFRTQNIYTLSDDLTISRGKHSLKFGALLNRWNQGFQGGLSNNGLLIFSSLAQFLESTPNLVEFGSFNSQDFIYNTIGLYAQDDWRVTSRLTLNLGYRYEFMTTPYELNGRESAIRNILTDATATIGPILKNPTLHNFSPRVGLAWDVFGNGRTALRSGFGIYDDVGNIGTTFGQEAAGTPPFSKLTDIFGPGTTFVQVPLSPSILNTPSTLTPQTVDYHSKQPYMIQYNLSVGQQLPWNLGLSVAYIGTRGVHLWNIKEGNPILPTSILPCGDPASLCVDGGVQFWDTGSPKYVRSNPNFGTTVFITTHGDSYYNALQTVLSKRVSNGLEFQSAYTYGKVLDTTQGQANTADCITSAGLEGVDPLHPKQVDKGPACFDATNNWEFSMLYHFPRIRSDNGFLSKAVNGWWVSSIVSVESGFPFSVVTALNRSNSGAIQGQNDRVDINTPALLAANPCTSQPGQPPAGINPCAYTPVPYNKNTVITHNINQWFNPAMFSMAPELVSPEQGSCAPGTVPCNFVGQLGDSSRDFLRGPASRNWDFSLVKDTPVGFLGEAGMLEFRAEIFNILNHPNFGMPSAVAFVGAPSNLSPFSETPIGGTGQITTEQGIPRQIQFALKVLF